MGQHSLSQLWQMEEMGCEPGGHNLSTQDRLNFELDWKWQRPT